ncbi:MAG: PLP-dependent transferase [Acidimicrobiales bacterium]
MNVPRRRAPALDLTGLHPDTVAVAAGRPHLAGQPVNTPMVPVSNYDSGNGPEYARGDGTDTWRALEDAVGALEGGKALAFSSGMAAISALFDSLGPGAKIVLPDDCYQGTATVVADGAARLGWRVIRLPTAETERWVQAAAGADFIWMETPSNPLLEIGDIATVCAAAEAAGALVAVDNTVATPLLQRPLDLGATFSVHSATKFIGGHSDLLAGIVVCADRQPGWDGFESLTRRRTYGGATPGTLESYLALRGLRTLSLRLERAQANAVELAERLDQHRLVTKVRYPGLLSHPGHDLARATLDGPGALLSFELVGSAVSTDVRLSKLQLIHRATSLGAVETCIERRAKLSGQDHLPPTLCRLSVGIEHVEDLWSDLVQAIDGLVD